MQDNKFINFFNSMISNAEVSDIVKEIYEVDRLVKYEILPYFIGDASTIPFELRNEVVELVKYLNANYLFRHDIQNSIRQTGRELFCLKVASAINKYKATY